MKLWLNWIISNLKSPILNKKCHEMDQNCMKIEFRKMRQKGDKFKQCGISRNFWPFCFNNTCVQQLLRTDTVHWRPIYARVTLDARLRLASFGHGPRRTADPKMTSKQECLPLHSLSLKCIKGVNWLTQKLDKFSISTLTTFIWQHS